MDNPILSQVLDTDSYKFSHWKQYPEGTTAMSSYFESRGGKYTGTVFFGLQYYLKRFLSKPITHGQINEASMFAQLHGEPFNREGWEYILEKYEGYMPVTIRAIPEGTMVPTNNILMDVTCEDPKCFWVVSWLETQLVRLWYPITVATQSWHMKQSILRSLERTADDPAGEIAFKLHDFGARGVTCQEQAMIGGAAHLVNFMGSDTVAGIWMANKYYNEDMAAFSIPAAEHSTMTMRGRGGELQQCRNMIEKYGQTEGGLYAVVSDSYDLWNCIDNIWCGELKDEVLRAPATLVVRPDSGDPVEIVPEVLRRLEAGFGSSVNTKGFKVLNKVKVIQGDGIDPDMIQEILFVIEKAGFSATNLAFGSGGGLLQKDINRDTQKFAFKCSWAKIDGKDFDVYKDPVTDKGKRSKKGRLDIVRHGKGVRTVATNGFKKPGSIMRLVYDHGQIKVEDTLTAIRIRANDGLIPQDGSWNDRDIVLS